MGKTITEKVVSVIGIIFVILTASNLLGVASTVSDDLATLPLGGLFANNGLVFLLIMVLVLGTVLTLAFKDKI